MNAARRSEGRQGVDEVLMVDRGQCCTESMLPIDSPERFWLIKTATNAKLKPGNAFDVEKEEAGIRLPNGYD
jgi:hypothetical protein